MPKPFDIFHVLKQTFSLLASLGVSASHVKTNVVI